MLILTRTINEAIIIGGDIRVSVASVRSEEASFTVESSDTNQPHSRDRLIGQTLPIAAAINLVVLGIRGRQVRLGVEAPKDVTVDREEVHMRKVSERPALNSYRSGRTQPARRLVQRLTAAVLG